MRRRVVEKVRQGFRKFCDETSMHGFFELFYAKTIFWRMVWFLLLATAIGVTIYQMIGQVSQYIDQPKITSIQPAETSDFVYPPLKICYPHWLYWVNWNKVSDLNLTVGGTLYGLSYLTWIYTPEDKETSEARYNSTMLKLKFSNVKEFYNAIMSDPSDTFKDLSYYETDFDVDLSTYSVNLCLKIESGNISNAIVNPDQVADRPANGKKSTTKNNVLQITISYNNFVDYAAYVTDAQYAEYVKDWLYTENLLYRSFEGNMSLVRLPMLLYPNAYDSNYIMIPHDADVMKITVSESITKVKPSGSFPCTEGLRWLGVSNSCKTRCAEQGVELFSNYSYMGIPLAVAMASNNYNYNIESNPFMDLSYFAIFNAVATTTQMDVATTPQPSTASSAQTSTATTGASDASSAYFNYYDISSNFTIQYENCIKNCEVGCITYQFTFTQQPFSLFQSTNPSDNSVTKVVINYPSTEGVLVMVEQDSKSWQDFVSNVGGLLGIWTGASILSFFQMFYLCCCVDCDCCRLQKLRKHHQTQNADAKDQRPTKVSKVGQRRSAWYM